MKKISMMLTAFALCVGGMLFAANPADFLPKDAALLVYIDAERISNIPWIKEMSNTHPDSAEKIKQLDALCAQLKIKREDFLSGAVYVAARSENQIGVYAQTKISETVLLNLVAEIVKEEQATVSVAETTIADRKVFVFKETAHDGENGGQVFALTYLASDVVMGFQPNDESAKLLQTSTGGCALLGKVSTKQLVSVICEPPRMVSAAEADQQDVTMVEVALNLTGANQRDLALNADVDFRSKEKTQEVGIQAQMVAPMMVGMIFGKDQALAGMLIQGLQITMPSEKRLNVCFTASEATLKALEEFTKKPANLPNFGQPGVGPGAAGAPAAGR